MEPRPNSFPVYVSGQYLTNENLNATHDFLWQEEKATRYLLCGNGVVQGLNLDFTDNALLKQVTITGGDAVTVDGYIIASKGLQAFDKGFSIQLSWIKLQDGTEQLMEKTAFDKAKESINPLSEIVLNAVEIFSTASSLPDLPVGTNTLDTFSISASQALSNYLVLAWVFVNDEEKDNCVQGDCNTKGIQRNFTARYFLVLNSQFPQQNVAGVEMPTCIAARIKNLSQAGSNAGFNQASFSAWSASLTELQPYFSAANSGKQLGLISSMLDAAEQTALTNAITRFPLITASVNNASCPQYYNAFASDLSKAINELILFYNDYAKKYPTYSQNRIESTVILGSFRPTGVDKWRYYFIPAPEQIQFTFDRKRLKQLFMRAVALVNNFILQANIKTQSSMVNKVLAIPTISGGDALLQDCAIPYYYDVLSNGVNNDVLKSWNPQSGSLRNIFCYYDQVIPARNNNPNMVAKLAVADWSGENFFRIEGHIGLTKDAAISAINALIVNDGLPIQLLDCDINYKGPINWYNWYQQFSVFLNDSLIALRANPATKNYAYDPFKNMTTSVQQTSYRQPDEVKSILNNLTAYSGVFYSTKIQQAAVPKAKVKRAAAAAATTPISQEVIDNYKKVIPQQKITDLVKGYNDAINEVVDPKAKKLIILKDLTGLEFLGGVPRGGTIFLLHSNGFVIGDGCLPYFYRVDQGRIFTT